MKKTDSYSVLSLLSAKNSIKEISCSGWIKTKRKSKGVAFLELNDGSCLTSIQVVLNKETKGYKEISSLLTGASVQIIGSLVSSLGAKQVWEIQAEEVLLIGVSSVDYPLQKKGHSDEFLRTIPHLRPRTNLYGAVFRVRARLASAVHRFFSQRQFFWLHSPIITMNDCEGGGELFSLGLGDEKLKKQGDELIRDSSRFFGRQAYLTVSGQLEAEAFASALSKVYTFGPTFRAENSNTTRHACEFWMIEPEIAFCNLEGIMDLAEDFLKFLVNETLENQEGDLEIFKKFIDPSLEEVLQQTRNQKFQRISYQEAFEILSKADKKFEYPIEDEMDFRTEHERYLVEEHFKSPSIVYNYPAKIKPFYMKRNEGGKTVAAMDVLVPRVGEIMGGSQREENLDVLEKAMKEDKLNLEEYQWYLDLRRYGSVPHSGFGLGFERVLMFLTGMKNIRDVLPFPRVPRNLKI